MACAALIIPLGTRGVRFSSLAITVRYSRTLLKLQCGKLKGGYLVGTVTLLYNVILGILYMFARPFGLAFHKTPQEALC